MIVVESKDGFELLTKPVPIRDGAARVGKATVRRLVREQRFDELAEIGVHVAERAEAPEGKRPVEGSEERIVDRAGKPVMVRQYEDIPPPPEPEPQPEPEPDTRSIEEKLANAAGVTVEELRAWRSGVVIGDSGGAAGSSR